MVVVLQRVDFASCEVDKKIISKIDKGLVLLIGFDLEDNETIVEKLAKKILNMRVFEDDKGKMNKNIFDIKGSILAISQFTLCANVKNGNRPSFDTCMQPAKANELYEYFIKVLKNQDIIVEKGSFGEHMIINIINNGPVTFILNS